MCTPFYVSKLKTPLRRSSHNLENNSNRITETSYVDVGLIHLTQYCDQLWGSCGHGNESLGFMQWGKDVG
jgi:hypothetical protein